MLAALLAGLLGTTACSGDDGSGTPGPDDTAGDATDGTTTTAEPSLDDQLDAVRAAFDHTIEQRSIQYSASLFADLPPASGFSAFSMLISSGSDEELAAIEGTVTTMLLEAGVEPDPVTAEVRTIDGIVWVSDADGWLGWTAEAAASAPLPEVVLSYIDADRILSDLRDATSEVVSHADMVGGTDQWTIPVALPDGAALGLSGLRPVEITAKTRSDGTVATIDYVVEVPADVLVGVASGAGGSLGTTDAVPVTVEIVIIAADRALPGAVTAPCPAPETVAGPLGATLRCPPGG